MMGSMHIDNLREFYNASRMKGIMMVIILQSLLLYYGP